MMENSVRLHENSFWYENSQKGLLEQIKWCYGHKYGPNNYNYSNISVDTPIGIVSPHAGFECSGPYAALSFELLKRNSKSPDTVIMLGPNHTGMGSFISLFPSPGIWKTPLGDLTIDQDISQEIFQESEKFPDLNIEYDTLAHKNEHSIDNQIPFLQNIYPKVSIVPICIMDQRYHICSSLGGIIAKIIEKNKTKKNILIVASSDFTHHVPHEKAVDQDTKLIDKLIELNLENANNFKNEKNVTACGFGPIIALFSAAQKLGKLMGEKIAYGTSGLTCSSKDQVVGYGSLII